MKLKWKGEKEAKKGIKLKWKMRTMIFSTWYTNLKKNLTSLASLGSVRYEIETRILTHNLSLWLISEFWSDPRCWSKSFEKRKLNKSWTFVKCNKLAPFYESMSYYAIVKSDSMGSSNEWHPKFNSLIFLPMIDQKFKDLPEKKLNISVSRCKVKKMRCKYLNDNKNFSVGDHKTFTKTRFLT